MQIIRSFDTDSIGWVFPNNDMRLYYHPLFGNVFMPFHETPVDDTEYDYVLEGDYTSEIPEYGTIVSPILSPSLVEQYLAFFIAPVHESSNAWQIALIDPDSENYQVYDENSGWHDSTEKVFYNDTELNEYLKKWYRGIQLEIRVPNDSFFLSFKIAFQVTISIEDYILDYGIQEFLSEKCHFAYPSSVIDNVIPFPKHFSKGVSDLVVREIRTGNMVTNPVIDYDNSIITGDNIDPDIVYFVSFNFVPYVIFVRGLNAYQIEHLPCIIVKRKAEDKFKYANRTEGIFTQSVNDPSQVLKDDIVAHYNLEIELDFIAEELRYCQMMYESIIRNTQDKTIQVPPIDSQYPLHWNTTFIRDNRLSNSPTIESISIHSISVTATIHNLTI